MIDVVAAGHICLDVIPDLSTQDGFQFDRQFRPGYLVETGAVSFAPGGSTANTGLALHKLGMRTLLIAKTGADPFGELLRRRIAAQDPLLAKGIVVDSETNTSFSIVISPQQSDRRFLHHPGANDQFISDDVLDDQVANTRLFHFGYPPLMAGMFANNGMMLSKLFQRMKRLGVTTSLDMAFPDPSSEAGRVNWQCILEQTLPHVDVFLPSLAEIQFMLGMDVANGASLSVALLQQIGNKLLEMGTKVVVLKLGDQGLYLQTASAEALKEMGRGGVSTISAWQKQTLWSPCFQVTAMGATGAGDSSIAGFLTAMLRGADPKEALVMGTAVGACCVEAIDAFSGLLMWSTTQQRIAAGWPRWPGPYPSDLETIIINPHWGDMD